MENRFVKIADLVINIKHIVSIEKEKAAHKGTYLILIDLDNGMVKTVEYINEKDRDLDFNLLYNSL